MTHSLPPRANRGGLEGKTDDEAREAPIRTDHWRAEGSEGRRKDRRSQSAARSIGSDNLKLEGQNGGLNEDSGALRQQRAEVREGADDIAVPKGNASLILWYAWPRIESLKQIFRNHF